MLLVKVPTSQGALDKKGSEKAPELIVESIKEFYLNESGNKHFCNVEDVEIVEGNIEETNKNIEKKAEKDAVFIGGDHSITYSLFKGFAKRNKNPGLIIFDAHPDCENDFSPPTHEDFVKVLMKEGVLNSKNVIIVGVRNWHVNEFKFLKENNIRYITAKQLFNNLTNVCDGVMEWAREFDSLYLSLDIDAVDPAFAPGTGYTEPGGLSSREMIYFVQRLKLLKNLKSMDLVEVNPAKDVNNMTVKLAAKLVVELL